jgi:hypothetical protein
MNVIELWNRASPKAATIFDAHRSIISSYDRWSIDPKGVNTDTLSTDVTDSNGARPSDAVRERGTQTS